MSWPLSAAVVKLRPIVQMPAMCVCLCVCVCAVVSCMWWPSCPLPSPHPSHFPIHSFASIPPSLRPFLPFLILYPSPLPFIPFHSLPLPLVPFFFTFSSWDRRPFRLSVDFPFNRCNQDPTKVSTKLYIYVNLDINKSIIYDESFLNYFIHGTLLPWATS